MNKQEILQKIKDEVDKDNLFIDWDDLLFNFDDMDKYVDLVSQSYAIAMCEEQRIKCSEACTALSDIETNKIDDMYINTIENTKKVAE